MQDSILVEQVAAEMQQEFVELVRWLLEHRDGELGRLEKVLLEQGHAMLCSLLGTVLASAPAAESWRQQVCTGCGERMRGLGKRSKWLHLSLGHVKLERSCYHCPHCHNTSAPLDKQLGIDQSGRSPRLVELIALLGAELPFAQAAARLVKLCPAVEAGESQVEAVTEAVGRQVEAEALAEVEAAWREPYAERVLPEVESESPQLVIALDEVMVPEREGYHEVRTTAVAGCGLGEQPESWRYVTHTGDVETLGRLVWCEAYRQELETAQRVAVVGDGAEWLWKLARRHFSGAIQILDLWHATEHLWAAGRALLREGDERVAGWVERAKQRLLGGEVWALLREWEGLVAQDAELWTEQLRYLRNQAPRMRYDEYIRQGLPIGSGVIESANRHVVGVRVKQAGMRWSRAGVRGVLALRALLRSGRWDDWWQSHPLPVPLPTAAQQ